MIGHKQLYFIIVDSDNNVFGHYHPGIINDTDNRCKSIFLFTLNSNGRNGVMKFDGKCDYNYTSIWCEKYRVVYDCNNINVDSFSANGGWIDERDICRYHEGIRYETLTGFINRGWYVYFTVKRLIVLEMQ